MDRLSAMQAGAKMRTIRTRLRHGTRGRAGFTLIELLVVIIIIAVLATIAIPTFLGQRKKAEDAVAYTLLRSALTAVQAAFAENTDFTQITAADLEAIEPTITWVESGSNLVSTSPAVDRQPGRRKRDTESKLRSSWSRPTSSIWQPPAPPAILLASRSITGMPARRATSKSRRSTGPSSSAGETGVHGVFRAAARGRG